MITRFRTIIVTASILATLVACAAPSTPTPVPPNLIRSWRLDRVVINGKVNPPFRSGQGIKFTSGNGFRLFARGNTIWGTFSSTPSGSFYIWDAIEMGIEKEVTKIGTTEKGPGQTIAAKHHADDLFLSALMSAVAYEIRDGELWLYYPEDKSNALVFR